MGVLMKVWVTRYVDHRGRRVSKGELGAKTVKQRSKKWYGQFKDTNDKWRRVPLCTDKAAALQMLAEHERDVARNKARLVDPYEQHRDVPIDDHVIAYEAYLRN